MTCHADKTPVGIIGVGNMGGAMAANLLALAGRMGLDLGTTLDVIEQSSGQSWIGSDRMRRAIDAGLAFDDEASVFKLLRWPG